MFICVGPFRYELVARNVQIYTPDGVPCYGLAWPDQQRIEFSLLAPPVKRLSVVWHELLHLARADFDIHSTSEMSEEAVCNLIGLVMAMISPMDLLRLHVYATEGVDAPAAMLTPNLPRPIPLLHFTRDS